MQGSTWLDPTPLEYPSASFQPASSAAANKSAQPSSSSSAGPFLVHEASHEPIVRPETLPDPPPSHLQARRTPKAEEPETKKKSRQSVSGNPQKGESALPNMNDILSGLLNVVGEGLSFATNLVKEESNKRKKAASKLSDSDDDDSGVPAVAAAASTGWLS